MDNYFPHLARAAFLAISERLDFDNLAVLALPLFKPPNLPRATAVGFLTMCDSSVAISVLAVAITFTSGVLPLLLML